jgi:hypothetical protein
MATQKKEDAAVIESGLVRISLPQGYVFDPRFGTLTEAGFKALNKGGDRVKLIAALREAADVIRQTPGIIPLPDGVTADTLDHMANQLEADLAIERDLDAAQAKASELRRLNLDRAGQTTSALIAQIKTSARLNTTLTERFPQLTGLYKRNK